MKVAPLPKTVDVPLKKSISSDTISEDESTRRKEKVIIINSGPLTKELMKEERFKSSYYASLWTTESASDLSTIIDNFDFDIILIDPSGKNSLSKGELEILSGLKISIKKVYNLISFYERITLRVPLAQLSNDWIVNSDLFYAHTNARFLSLKRFFDILLALSVLPVATFLILIACVLIRLTSKGPAFFVQNRVGKGGKSFRIYKLRTMFFSSENSLAHTVKNDNRITPIGKLLRLTKVDELPQLLNILKGEMSLVGPRPERVEIAANCVRENPYYCLRHLIKPGVTGWAQVHHPTATPLENLQKLEYDLFYVKHMSPLQDLKIIWHTFRIVLTLNSN